VPAYRPFTREVEREIEILGDPVWQQARPTVARLVRMLQRAERYQDFWELQLELISYVRGLQTALGALRSELADLKKKLATLTATQPTPLDAIRDVQSQIADYKRRIDVQDGLRWLMLTIGDGLAWRCLDYDRAMITILGRGQRVAWLSGDEGWAAELEHLRAEYEAGNFALLNDMTTCIRNGDITARRPEGINVYEVKAGELRDDTPQMRRLQQAVDFINTGEVNVDGEPGGYIRCRRRYRTHLAQLSALLRKAEAQGTATAKVSPVQFVIAVDFRKGEAAAKLSSYEDALAASGWSLDDIVLSTSTTIRRMRERHHSFPSLAPLSLYPLEAEQVCDLLHGSLNISGMINVSLLARSLGDHGIEAEPVAPPKSEEVFLRIFKRTSRSSGVEGSIVADIREMMMLELMTPATLRYGIDALVDHVSASSGAPQREMVFWADEARTWSHPQN